MSVGEMSATLQNKIAESIEQAITKNGKLQLNVRSQTAHLDYASQDSIRKDTDTVKGKHESIMSRGALDKLKNSLLSHSKESRIIGLTDEIIDNLNLESFVEFILTNYASEGAKLKESKARSDPSFSYSAPIRLDNTSTRLILGTSTDTSTKNRDILILKNIPHGKLVEYFVEYIKSNVNLTGIDPAAFTKELKALFNAGHLTGIFTGRLIRAFGVKNKDSFSVAGGDVEVSNIVQAAIDLVTTADALSSNIYDDPKLFLRTDKRLYANALSLKLTTEVQFARAVSGEKGNQDVGQLLSTAGRYLSNAIKAVKSDISKSGRASAAGTAVSKLFTELDKINKYIKERQQVLSSKVALSPELQKVILASTATSNTFEALISSKGSDSVLDHIGKIAAKGLGSSVKLDLGISIAKATRVLKKVSAKKPTKLNSKVKSDIAKISAKLKAVSTAIKLPEYSLASLQILLDAQLQHVVAANMGNGSSKNTLNYRTGRLAASAKVERLSQSREGMITAFYSYMRNPYATFSDGGRQQYPKSRDPKLLISQSIKEIMATKVSNRMRAVLV